MALVNALAATFILVVTFGVTMVAVLSLYGGDKSKPTWHRLIEGRALAFTVLALIAVLVGGVAEIVPSIVVGTAARHSTSTTPYTALELEGRDVYLREGCYTCHSQMIRPLAFETARYGEPSTPDDSIFDHPFQWGSKRTGPDLAHVGTKYSYLWHWQHMRDPRSTSVGSNMPSYAHLATEQINFDRIASKMNAMQTVGVPYTDEQISRAAADARARAQEITDGLMRDGHVHTTPDSELIALIAYLQRLGHPTGVAPEAQAAVATHTGGAQ